MKITKKHITVKASSVFADDRSDDSTDGLLDAVDDVADAIDDIQEGIDDVKEDSVDIAVNNNISNHYVAECDGCQGVFISAVIKSDQAVDSISGICPLCNNSTTQYLKWVIKDANETN